MNERVQGMKAEFTPQLEDIKAMALQDVAVARERLAERSAIARDYVMREPVKAVGIALCIGVVLGWLIKRP
jgi:ElaB/YqjD/DUF883 family membrane-anchored ribosome-binding protein